MKEGNDMKKYTNAKAEIYKLDAGDIMLTSVTTAVDLDSLDRNEDNAFSISNWGNWNAN